MGRKEELLAVEQERWAEFMAVADAIPDSRADEPIANDDAWSAKDVLWHMRSWDEEVAHELGTIRNGTYVEISDEEADRKNALFLAEGRSLGIATVRTEMAISRTRAVAEMHKIEEVTEAVEEWFSESAWRHIDDHIGELRAVLASSSEPRLDRP